jgi:hypothetical protein
MFVGVKSCHPRECFLFYLLLLLLLFFNEYHPSECICCRVKYWL